MAMLPICTTHTPATMVASVYACIVDVGTDGVFAAHIILTASVFILLRRPTWITVWHEAPALAFITAVQFAAIGACPWTQPMLVAVMGITKDLGGCDRADGACISRALNHFRWGMLAVVAAWAVVKLCPRPALDDDADDDSNQQAPVAAPVPTAHPPVPAAHPPVNHPVTSAHAPVSPAHDPRDTPPPVACTNYGRFDNCGTAMVMTHSGPLTINASGLKTLDCPNLTDGFARYESAAR